MEAQSASAYVGRVIGGRYRVLKVLSETRHDVLLQARRDDIEQLVAIKMLKASGVVDPVVEERFQREIHATASLQHPNIVSVYDAGGYSDGRPFYVMEYVHAQMLRSVCDSAPISPKRVFGIVRQLCAGVGAAHAAGIAHRGLEPDSIFIAHRDSRHELVTVADFGLAKVRGTASKLTRVGQVIGNVAYLAPELAVSRPKDQPGDEGFGVPSIDAQSDVYAIGCIAFELLVGRPPLLGASPLGTMRRRRAEVVDWPATQARQVPAALRDVVDRMLAACLKTRPASALEALRLVDTLDPSSLDVAEPSDRWPARERTAEYERPTAKGPKVVPAALELASPRGPAPTLVAPSQLSQAPSANLGRGMALLSGGRTVITVVHTANERVLALTCHGLGPEFDEGESIAVSFPAPQEKGGQTVLRAVVVEAQPQSRATRLVIALGRDSRSTAYSRLLDRWYDRG